MSKPEIETTRSVTVRYDAADLKRGLCLAELIVFVNACQASGADPSAKIDFRNGWRGQLTAVMVTDADLVPGTPTPHDLDDPAAAGWVRGDHGAERGPDGKLADHSWRGDHGE